MTWPHELGTGPMAHDIGEQEGGGGTGFSLGMDNIWGGVGRDN